MKLSQLLFALLGLSCLATCSAFAPSLLGLRPMSTDAMQARRISLTLSSRQGARGRVLDSRSRSNICMMAKKQVFKSMEDMLQNSETPILVDFYATWCGPCVLMARELATLSNDPEVKDKLMIVKVDTEKYPQISSKYSVEALPTIVLFKNGQIVDRFEGVVMASQLKQMIMSKL